MPPRIHSENGRLTGSASVYAARPRVKVGEPLELMVRFHCERGVEEVFDPFFCTGDPNRAALRVFDNAGNYVGNALGPIEYENQDRKRWLRIWSDMTVGRTVRIGTADDTSLAQQGVDRSAHRQIAQLGAGKYVIQFVLCGRFLDAHNDGEYAPVPRVADPSNEICYSSVLPIEVSRTAEQGNERQQSAGPCDATLTVEKNTVRISEGIACSFEVRNVSSKTTTVLNPVIPLRSIEAERLIIYYPDDKPLGDLLEFQQPGKRNGSQGPLVSDLYWVSLPPSGLIGAKTVATVRNSINGVALKPGTYRLRMAFLDTFISENPYAGLPDVNSAAHAHNDPRYVERRMKWRHEHPGEELFRSNAVDITISDSK